MSLLDSNVALLPSLDGTAVTGSGNPESWSPSFAIHLTLRLRRITFRILRSELDRDTIGVHERMAAM